MPGDSPQCKITHVPPQGKRVSSPSFNTGFAYGILQKRALVFLQFHEAHAEDAVAVRHRLHPANLAFTPNLFRRQENVNVYPLVNVDGTREADPSARRAQVTRKPLVGRAVPRKRNPDAYAFD